MAATASTMLALGTAAPSFRLPDTDGHMVSLADFAEARALLVAFICNHCPYVIHIRPALVAFAAEYARSGLATVAISSNDAHAYPADAPERMAEVARASAFSFPYLYDESQAVAKAYHAACTPDLFLFDGERRLVYRGQFDASRPGNGMPVTGSDLRSAVDALLADERMPVVQTPSIGCSIKWKSGSAPLYAD